MNSPCCTQGRAWGASIAGPNLPMFFTRPTPDRTVVRPFRARPRRRGGIAGEGSRVSPPRYREVIPLPQQTPAESGARPPAIRRSDGVAKTAGPRARSRPAGGHPVHTAPQPGRRQHPYRSGTGGRGRIGEGVPARFTHGPTASPHRSGQNSPSRRQPTTEGKEGTPSIAIDQELPRGERPAPREPAGGQPSRDQRFQKGRRGRPAVGVGTGQRQSLSSPLVVSQPAGCSYRHCSRRAPPSLEKSARTRLAAEGSWDL